MPCECYAHGYALNIQQRWRRKKYYDQLYQHTKLPTDLILEIVGRSHARVSVVCTCPLKFRLTFNHPVKDLLYQMRNPVSEFMTF